MHYVFAGWAGGDIVESFACFLVTERLTRALDEAGPIGFQLDDVQTSVDEQFVEYFPEDAARSPSWKWLRLMSMSRSSTGSAEPA